MGFLGRARAALRRSEFLVALVKAARSGRCELRRVGRARKIRAYLRSHAVRKLQIGTGPNVLDGWLNTDVEPAAPEIVFLDAGKPLPFDDATFDYVFGGHVIEHLGYEAGLAMLRECARVLRPGGTLRLATPNLQAVAALYGTEHGEREARFIRWNIDRYVPYAVASPNGDEPNLCFVINNLFRNFGHQFIYDARTFRLALTQTGFVDITETRPGESNDPGLQGAECRARDEDEAEINALETMVLEARRPVGG